MKRQRVKFSLDLYWGNRTYKLKKFIDLATFRSYLLRVPVLSAPTFQTARNPNLQVVITHASHVCSQHSFGLPLRMYGMHRTHFDRARFDFLSLVI